MKIKSIPGMPVQIKTKIGVYLIEDLTIFFLINKKIIKEVNKT